MLISKSLETIASLILEARTIRAKSLTLQGPNEALGIDSEERVDLFKEIELSLKKAEKAIGKPAGYNTMGDYEYSAPSEIKMRKPDVETDEEYIAISESLLREDLSILAGKIQSFKDAMSNDKWKIVDGNKNTVSFLTPTEKGFFTKTITSIDKLISTYQ